MTGRRLWLLVVASMSIAATQGRSVPAAPVRIKADQLEVKTNLGQVDFSGNVVAIQGDFQLRCDRLSAHYLPGTQIVDSLEAVGRIRWQQGIRNGTAGTAHYAVPVSDLTMYQNPVVNDGPNTLSGQTIFYNTGTGRLKVDSAKTTFYRSASTGFTHPASNNSISGRQK